MFIATRTATKVIYSVKNNRYVAVLTNKLKMKYQ